MSDKERLKKLIETVKMIREEDEYFLQSVIGKVISIDASKEVLPALVEDDDDGTGEANLLAIYNDMSFLVEIIMKMAERYGINKDDKRTKDNIVRGINKDDIDWLIEQAEKVEQLQQEIMRLSHENIDLQRHISRQETNISNLEMANGRLKKLANLIIEESTCENVETTLEKVVSIAKQMVE